MDGFRVTGCGDISRPVKLSRRDVEVAEETQSSPEGENNSTVDANGGVLESFVISNGSRWTAGLDWGATDLSISTILTGGAMSNCCGFTKKEVK